MNISTILYIAIASIISGFPIIASAQINKCVVAGKVSYQDIPCEKVDGEKLKIYVPSTTNYSPSPEAQRALKNTENLRKDVEDAQKVFDDLLTTHCAGKVIETPVIGMSEDDFLCIERYKNPEKINRSVSGGGESNQRVYRNHGRTTYIYFTNGKLSSMQGEMF